MIELKDIRKSYKTGDFIQHALDGVSITFRDNEFVAILGPSGSGKTTLLNILGGLDHYDDGDLVVDGISTKSYRDRDWDTYRNHRIGFVFQSYNLIPHQSILANVELALTLAGIGHAERRRRAQEALERVGLGEHASKRPSQLSGGQMQRVAIARALVNDPSIVLADEPTGALDGKTGIQVMDLLKEIAQDRLVIMVTHNPDLAHDYATRTVNLADGKICGDTMPLTQEELDAAAAAPAATDSSRRASMSFLTALALSFNNLMTKKGRTFLTSFAGSIGIIGIAAILALSNGVNSYIQNTEEDALTSYPLSITKSSFDISSLLGATMGDESSTDTAADDKSSETKEGQIPKSNIMSRMFKQVKNNDLETFKAFLDGGGNGIGAYVNTIQYDYDVTPQIYPASGTKRLSPSDASAMFDNGFSSSAFMGTMGSSSSFDQMMDDTTLLSSQLEVVQGKWAEAPDECVLVLNRRGKLSDYTTYALGIDDIGTMETMMRDALSGKEVTPPEHTRDITYDEALNLSYRVLPACEEYRKNEEQGVWTSVAEDKDALEERLANAPTIHVVGVVKPREDAKSYPLREGIAYTSGLTRLLMDRAASSQIVAEQKEHPDVDVFTGKTFDELADEKGSGFDMGSMFTVDTEALQKAFTIDTSGMSAATSGMDLSGLDLSKVDFSAIDMSNVQIDTNAIASAMDSETLVKILTGAPQPDLSGIQADVTPEQQQKVQQINGQLMGGFITYVVTSGTSMADMQDATKMGEMWAAYTQTDAAKDLQRQLSEATNAAYGEAVNQAMNDYMTKTYIPYLQTGLSTMMGQAAEVMANQMASSMATTMAAATDQLGSTLATEIQSSLSGSMEQLSSALENSFSFDASAFANAIQVNMTQEDLTSLLNSYLNAGQLTYDGNLKKLGYAETSKPTSISIYSKDFEAKDNVVKIIDTYNEVQRASDNEHAVIQYSDIAGTLMTSVTSIVGMISLVLIAFVSISLVVSSIMIGIITYISVLERKKEIGILRAMGASKGNVANVFNAETFIEGLFAGVLAIAVVQLISIPVNAIVWNIQKVPDIMQLPVTSGIILIIVSIVLTLVAGIMPSMSAARRDPVEALRSE